MVEREFHKLRVAGSSPAVRTACAPAARPYPGGRARFASVAQFGKSGRLKPGRSQVQLLPGAQDNFILNVCFRSSMDRVPASGAGGRGFESRRERAIKTCLRSSDGQSGSLLMNRSRVRVPPGALGIIGYWLWLARVA